MSEETRKCPYCGGEVLAIAKKCKHCGKWIPAEERGDRGFFDWYFIDVFFRHYADFSGRLARGRFWGAYILYYVIYGVLFGLEFALYGIPVVSSLFAVATIIPGLAMQVRRLHDVGKSGWWIFINCVPFIGTIWYLVLLLTGSKEED